jgi:hypothetical protein
MRRGGRDVRLSGLGPWPRQGRAARVIAWGGADKRGNVSPRIRYAHPARWVGIVELATGVAAVVGGLLLAIRPDGSLISADPDALQGSPFTDWRLPGLLLVAFVGLGFIGTGVRQMAHARYHRELSLIAGFGLIGFEVAELAWLGFQPLEAVFAVVGAFIAGSSWRHKPAAAGSPSELRSRGRAQSR